MQSAKLRSYVRKKEKMCKKKRAKKELKKAFDAFSYEMWMFNKTSKELLEKTRSNNSLIESFVMHTRNLLGFFCSKNPHCDDIIAEDFFTSPKKWKSNSPQDFEIDLCIENIRFRINKMGAHLTFTRLTIFDKGWPVKEIGAYINKLYQRFYSDFDKQYLGEKFKELYQEDIDSDGQYILSAYK